MGAGQRFQVEITKRSADGCNQTGLLLELESTPGMDRHVCRGRLLP